MPSDPLSSTLFALSDPTRRGLLARLATGDANVTELAEPYDMSLAAISRHLKVLETAGLISRGREAQWRPCKLNPDQLKTAADWLGKQRKIWEESFDRLDSYLLQLQSKTRAKTKTKEKDDVRTKPRKH